MAVGFSRKQQILDAISHKQRRNKTLAGGEVTQTIIDPNDPSKTITKTFMKLPEKDFKEKHPDWCRDAVVGNFTILLKKSKELVEDKSTKFYKRRKKNAPRK